MRTSSALAVARATETDRPFVSATDQTVENVLAAVAKTLWPTNTAPNLAHEIGCEIRTAERYLEGSRAWSGDAIAILIAEIMRRHSTRNIKIKSRV